MFSSSILLSPERSDLFSSSEALESTRKSLKASQDLNKKDNSQRRKNKLSNLENNPEQPEPKEKQPPPTGAQPEPIGLQPPNDGEQPPPDIGTDLVFLDKHPDLEDAGIEVSSCKVLFICDLSNELDSFKPFPFSVFFLSGEQPRFNLFVKELLVDKSSFLLLYRNIKLIGKYKIYF